MRRRFPVTHACAALLLAAVAWPAAAAGETPEAPAPAARQSAAAAPAPTLAGLEFMSGCWRSGAGEGYFEEIYTRPTPNLMLGLSIYVREGRAVGYELTRVAVEGGRVVLTPYPDGERSPHGFALTTLGEDEAIFEAPEHDYPKRILYRRNTDGSRWARIDGGPADAEGQEWRFVAAPCPGEAATTP
jgi:hypothetical protein